MASTQESYLQQIGNQVTIALHEIQTNEIHCFHSLPAQQHQAYTNEGLANYCNITSCPHKGLV
eukprot:751254-Hanusia_phi.AAC.3